MRIKITTILYLFLFAVGFEFTILDFSQKEITSATYMMGIFASCLLLLYIIPLLFGINILIKKLKSNWIIFTGAFISGCFIATFFSIYGSNALEYVWATVLSKDIMEQWADALSAPFAEEIIKAFICVLFLYIMKEMKIKSFLIAGIGIGLGFQVLEDITYIIPDTMDDHVMNEIIPTAMLRISGFAASHWMYTALVAVGLYLVYKRRKVLKAYVYILGPVALHFIWNSPFITGDMSVSLLSPLLTTITFLLFISSLKEVFTQEELASSYDSQSLAAV